MKSVSSKLNRRIEWTNQRNKCFPGTNNTKDDITNKTYHIDTVSSSP